MKLGPPISSLEAPNRAQSGIQEWTVGANGIRRGGALHLDLLWTYSWLSAELPILKLVISD